MSSSSSGEVSIPVIGVGAALWAYLTIGTELIRRMFPIESQRWYEFLGAGPGPSWLFLPIAVVMVAGLVALQAAVVKKWNRSDIAVSILIAVLVSASSQVILMIEASLNGLTGFATMRAMFQLVGLAGASVLVNRAVTRSAHNQRKFASTGLIESR